MHAFKVKFECSVLVSHEKFSCRNQVVFILLYSPAYPIETSCVLFNECIRWKITGLIFQRGFIVSLRGYQDELYNYILLFRSRFFFFFLCDDFYLFFKFLSYMSYRINYLKYNIDLRGKRCQIFRNYFKLLHILRQCLLLQC